jgi:hypothetical protein
VNLKGKERRAKYRREITGCESTLARSRETRKEEGADQRQEVRPIKMRKERKFERVFCRF